MQKHQQAASNVYSLPSWCNFIRMMFRLHLLHIERSLSKHTRIQNIGATVTVASSTFSHVFLAERNERQSDSMFAWHHSTHRIHVFPCNIYSIFWLVCFGTYYVILCPCWSSSVFCLTIQNTHDIPLQICCCIYFSIIIIYTTHIHITVCVHWLGFLVIPEASQSMGQ